MFKAPDEIQIALYWLVVVALMAAVLLTVTRIWPLL